MQNEERVVFLQIVNEEHRACWGFYQSGQEKVLFNLTISIIGVKEKTYNMTMKIEILKEPENKHGLKGAALFNEHRTDKDILKAMDEDTYEELITSWAYWCLKKGKDRKYEDTFRIGGSGDGGIDVIAYYDISKRDCDIYQCKHYDHPVNRGDVIAELGKFLYHVHIGAINIPRNYYLMAPQSLSGPFQRIYSSPDNLKKEIKDSWNKDIASNIEAKKTIKLDESLSTFIDGFNFTIFKFVSPDKLIDDVHQRENRHVYFQYFGVRKDDVQRIKINTPVTHQDYEANYIQYLLDAYNDVKNKDIDHVTSENISDSGFARHFEFSRDEFWMAESIKKMSEENCPGDTDEFKELEKDMLHHIADTYEEKYTDALERVKAVTRHATTLPKKENRIISGELGPGELKGVCFQLSNKNELIWKKK